MKLLPSGREHRSRAVGDSCMLLKAGPGAMKTVRQWPDMTAEEWAGLSHGACKGGHWRVCTREEGIRASQ